MAQTTAVDFPQAPTLGTMIGIPTTSGVSVEVVETDAVDLSGIRLAPAPQYAVAPSAGSTVSAADGLGAISADLGATLIEKSELHPAWAGTDGWLPSAVVVVGQTGALAAQPVAQIQFTPVQYNPLRQQLKLYTRVRARVTWAQNASASAYTTANSAQTALWNAVLANQTAVQDGLMQPQTVAAPSSVVRPDAAPEGKRLAKIMVSKDGIYKITADSLIPIINSVLAKTQQTFHDSDLPRLALVNAETEIPIEVHDGGDGKFNGNDYILFYGAQVRNDSKLPGGKEEPCAGFVAAKPDHWYTETNVYWVVLLSPPAMGLRMDQTASAPTTNSARPEFRVIRHFEEDTPNGYWQTLPGQNCEERWFWGRRLVDERRPFTFTVGAHQDLLSNTAMISITLRGYSTDTMQSIVSLEGGQVGGAEANSIALEGQVRKTGTFSAQLQPGPTQYLQVKADSGGRRGANQFFVDSFDLDYRQKYDAAKADSFVFGKSQDRAEMILVEHAAQSMELFDITNPLQPSHISINPVQANDTFTFTSESSPIPQMIPCQGNLYWGRCYLAVTPEAIMMPALTPASSAWLTSTGNMADYVIITDPAFEQSANELADHRGKVSKLTTQVVTINQIYDEFNNGIQNPAAIRNFLDYAYHCWNRPDNQEEPQHKLAYVLLMGDASQDYKNRRGDSRNYVPSFNFESSLFGEISSDSWFANMTAEGAYDCNTQTAAENVRDALPDLFMGRIPITDTAGAETIIAKIKQYDPIINPGDQTEPPPAWMRNVLFVSDDEKKFRATLDVLTKTLPPPYNITSIEVPDVSEDPSISNQQPYAMAITITNAINEGQLLVTYIGHGDNNAWGRWDADPKNQQAELNYFFHVEYLRYIAETGRLSMYAMGNCLNGYFAAPPNNLSMAEKLLLKPASGAVAVWAPTGLGYPSGHRELLSAFNNLIFGLERPSAPYDGRELGVAAHTAMLKTIAANSFWQELTTTYVLFGDPAMRIHSSSMSYLPVAAR
ncbi:MAG: hypothetical protein KDE47_20395, partial [Caldilineaceae bacterium]|nr:hypothetical protein [Caldilineaceae bacterium]